MFIDNDLIDQEIYMHFLWGQSEPSLKKKKDVLLFYNIVGSTCILFLEVYDSFIFKNS